MCLCPLPLRKKTAVALAAVFAFFLPVSIAAQSPAPSQAPGGYASLLGGRGFFPGILFTSVIDSTRQARDSSPYWVRSEQEQRAVDRLVSDFDSILFNNDILAFYGHPLSRNMGILGRYPMEEQHKMLVDLAQEYKAVNGGREVKLAFYIIYGTVWPGGDIGIINSDVLKRWIEFAQENDMLVFIDHQIGRFDPVDSLTGMFKWLDYPNVHLALDPEWQTPNPSVEIGSISAAQLNRAQEVMEDYIIRNNIPGERMLVVHQFHYKMISDRQNVRSDFRRVRLVHNADGFGPPGVKRSSYAYNAGATNIPVKGFKLFFDFGIPGAGIDNPLMTPAQVMALQPRPLVIMYQ